MGATIRFFSAMAVGMGQIMLQRSALTGLFSLVGIGLNSIPMLAGAVVGLVVSTATALALKADNGNFEDGLYGFNGALVGIAAFFFLPMTAITVSLAAAGAALSSVLMYAFLKADRPAYTAPFVTLTWVVLLVSPLLQPALVPLSTSVENPPNHLDGVMQGLGQIMFQANTWSGIVFLAGLSVSSRRDALFGLIGSGLGMTLALLIGLDPKSVMCGLFGYNSALCAIALSRKPIGYPMISSAAAVALTVAFMKAGVTALTAPFVLTTWGALLVNRTVSANKAE